MVYTAVGCLGVSALSDLVKEVGYAFHVDGDSSKLAIATNLSGKERSKGIKGVAGPSQKASRLKSTYSEKKHVLERPANILTSFDQNDKRTQAPELQMSIVPKDFCFDELESVVKIKQAEAKMFQSRADDARREAEGLKRIALEKSEKIDEEYTQQIAKLRLGETKEMRRQKLEKLQALERANLEYFNMKRRMEADPIKDLLSNMETTKRSLALSQFHLNAMWMIVYAIYMEHNKEIMKWELSEEKVKEILVQVEERYMCLSYQGNKGVQK
ncbi:hypothetical protein Ahy_A02g006544 [Arachis hypogaea]|uniref:Oberon coiled-coil region domain-containing protein n=1 Tax=Arachis hypogaea TaxID=3818 RepID=A0A445EAK2_ARAHY|nr:hypothetical protein Ahy_A02g006544 [Arachis hypogaea]